MILVERPLWMNEKTFYRNSSKCTALIAISHRQFINESSLKIQLVSRVSDVTCISSILSSLITRQRQKPIKSNPQLNTCQYCSFIHRTCSTYGNLSFDGEKFDEQSWKFVEENKTWRFSLTSAECHILAPWSIPSSAKCSCACSKYSRALQPLDCMDAMPPSHLEPFWMVWKEFRGQRLFQCVDMKAAGVNRKQYLPSENEKHHWNTQVRSKHENPNINAKWWEKGE